MIDFDNDDDLADAVQKLDIDAQEAFFNKFQLPLIKYAMSRQFSAEDAEELAQEALAQGFMTIASFRRGESLVRWLVGIELNFMRRRWAEKSPGITVPLEDDADSQPIFGIPAELDPREAKELGSLWSETLVNMTLAQNQTYMDAVRLRYLDRLSYTEIEEALQLGKNIAKVYVQRGLKVLRDMHEAIVPEDSSPARDE